MHEITKELRDYKACYAVTLVRKLMVDKQYVIFTRNLINTISMKVSARFFRFAFYFKIFFKNTDMTTIFLTSASFTELQKLKKDQMFAIITPPINLGYALLTFTDFSGLQIEKIIFWDLFNFYFQYFQKELQIYK